MAGFLEYLHDSFESDLHNSNESNIDNKYDDDDNDEISSTHSDDSIINKLRYKLDLIGLNSKVINDVISFVFSDKDVVSDISKSDTIDNSNANNKTVYDEHNVTVRASMILDAVAETKNTKNTDKGAVVDYGSTINIASMLL